jgi:aminoglycoside phosphotransferase (APT) family kinase protein
MEPNEDIAHRILVQEGHEPRSIVRITDGFSHHMYECDIGRKVILRIASADRDEKSNIAKELWVMDAFREQGVPVPEILSHNIGDDFPFHYIIMKKLSDRALSDALPSMDKKQRLQIMRSIGKLMAKMHIPLKEFGELCADGRLFRERSFKFRKIKDPLPHNPWIAHQLKDIGENLGELRAYGLIDAEKATRILAYAYSNTHLLQDATPVLCHVDLIPNHIFIKDGEVTGIIDFEFAAAYPREFEFVKFSRLGILENEEEKNALLEGYGKEKLSANFDRLLTYYRVTRDLGFCRHTAQSGDIDACRAALARVLALITAAGGTPP